jgi:hypothetical protein
MKQADDITKISLKTLIKMADAIDDLRERVFALEEEDQPHDYNED